MELHRGPQNNGIASTTVGLATHTGCGRSWSCSERTPPVAVTAQLTATGSPCPAEMYFAGGVLQHSHFVGAALAREGDAIHRAGCDDHGSHHCPFRPISRKERARNAPSRPSPASLVVRIVSIRTLAVHQEVLFTSLDRLPGRRPWTSAVRPLWNGLGHSAPRSDACRNGFRIS